MPNDWLNVNGNYLTKTETYFNDTFSLSFASVAELANYLINPGVLPSLIQSPQDFLNGLTLFPFDTSVFSVSSEEPLMIGSFTAENVKVRRITQAFAFFAMGEYYVARKFNNFADFNGYTKIQVWLPYYGFVDVNPNDVMGKYMQFLLAVDYKTGQATYYIAVSDVSIEPASQPFAGSKYKDCRIISTLAFQLGYQIPLGATNASEIYRNIIMGAVKSAAMAAGAYVSAKAGAGKTDTMTVTTTTSRMAHTRASKITGRKLKDPYVEESGTQSVSETHTDSSNFIKGRAISETFENSAQTLSMLSLGAKTDIVNNPSLVALGSRTVKVIIYRPLFKDVNQYYDHLYGRPLGEVKLLGTLEGYTEISNVHIEAENLQEDEEFSTATELEIAMLQDALLNGVIL